MLNKYHHLALAALLGIGAFAMPVTGASAAAIPAVKQMTVGDDLRVDVRHRCGHNRVCSGRWSGRWDGRRWDRHRHGNRYRYRRGNYVHFHGGYYYSNPWWLVSVPIIVGGSSYRGGNRHVRWCFDHYRSYNPRNNTWVSYSGHVRQCISPYSY